MQAANFGQGAVLDLHASSPLYHDPGFDAVSYFEGIATWDEAADSLVVFAVNRNLNEPLALEGGARQFAGYLA